MLIDDLVPVPEEVSRRAWTVAFWLGAEHSNDIGSEPLWHLLQWIVVNRDPGKLTWTECALLFNLERVHRAARP